MTKAELQRATASATQNVLTVPAGGLNLLLRALHACGLVPVIAGGHRFDLPHLTPGAHPCLFATPAGLADRWPDPDNAPACLTVSRRADGRTVACWGDWDGEPSGLGQAVGPAGGLLRRVYAELAANFHLTTAVSAVGGTTEDVRHRVEPDGSVALTFYLNLPGDDPTMADSMRMPQTFHITVDPKGNSKVEVVGGQGDSCLAATRKLIDMLGTEETTELKPEFYQQEEQARVEATS